MKNITLILLLLFYSNLFGQSKYQKDFLEFLNIIDQNYAYLDKQSIDIKKLKEIYFPVVSTVHTDDDFISFLEKVLNEFYNGHISLSTNLKSSNNIIPSGTDLFVEKIRDHYILTDIRKNSGAEKCGLKPGMEIIKFNDSPIPQQLNKFLPKSFEHHNDQMIQYAVSMLFAGTHDKNRTLTVLENGSEKNYYPDNYEMDFSPPIFYQFKNKDTGTIKINNSLGDYNSITQFDRAVDSLMDAKQLIIDLTETPSGGNSTVARAIMGRFITGKLAFQQHEMDEKPYDVKRYWIEYVLPRQKSYKGKIIVLVGHWTGSMGEGMAIGFDRMKNATVVGTRMAGLIGAISHFDLPETKIGFQIPTERLYHINGTPREDFIPGKSQVGMKK